VPNSRYEYQIRHNVFKLYKIVVKVN
jgi:hypothetical protein